MVKKVGEKRTPLGENEKKNVSRDFLAELIQRRRGPDCFDLFFLTADHAVVQTQGGFIVDELYESSWIIFSVYCIHTIAARCQWSQQ